MDSLGIPELTGALAAVSAFTVWVINQIRAILYRHAKWALRVPSGVWLGLSVIIPIGICVAANLNFFQALLAQQAPEAAFRLEGYGSVASGVLAAIASNGSYAVLRKSGLMATTPKEDIPTECVQESTTNPVDSDNLEQGPPLLKDTAPSVNKAVLLQQVTPGKSGPPMYVWTGTELLPVNQEKDS